MIFLFLSPWMNHACGLVRAILSCKQGSCQHAQGECVARECPTIEQWREARWGGRENRESALQHPFLLEKQTSRSPDVGPSQLRELRYPERLKRR
jgi:hypothetical protein